MYDVKGKSVKADAHSVVLLDLINVDNPHIFNTIIDQRNIEKILVTESNDHAKDITSKKENVPPNLSRVILLEPYCEYYPAPLFRSYALKNFPLKFLRIASAHHEK